MSALEDGKGNLGLFDLRSGSDLSEFSFIKQDSIRRLFCVSRRSGWVSSSISVMTVSDRISCPIQFLNSRNVPAGTRNAHGLHLFFDTRETSLIVCRLRLETSFVLSRVRLTELVEDTSCRHGLQCALRNF